MSRYDRAVTVFSPSGQLLQVEYAQEAARKGSAAVGVRGQGAVVLAVEKRAVGKMQVDRTEKRIVALDDHVAMVFSGLRADARVMISRSQIECQSYRLAVEDAVTIEYIAQYIAGMKQMYTQMNGLRPFGLSCVVGGFDYDGTPRLFQTEPSGMYYEWKACSAGRRDGTVLDYLEKNYSAEAVATEEGTISLAVRALLEVAPTPGHGQRNLEVAVLKRDAPIQMLKQDATNAILADIKKEKDGEESKEEKK